MFESQASFWIKIEMNSTVIIGYGWHLHISVIHLNEAVQLYWHRLNTLNGVTWNICRGYILQFKINVKSVSAKRKSTSVVYWYRLNCFHYFPHLKYSQCWMAELSFQTFDHRDLSEYHSNNLKFHASCCHLTWSECPRAYCLFVYLFVKLNQKLCRNGLFPVRMVILQ